MAHFAQLDENNVVVQVIVAGDEYEQTGEQLYAEIAGGVWKRTSYNTSGGVHTSGGTPFRKNYAGIGFTYDEQRDAFIPPKPFESWALNEQSCLWEAPVQKPIEGGPHYWNETTQTWDAVE